MRSVMRVLVIDDSVLARRVVTRTLSREPLIEVVGAMGNGRAAVVRAERLRPDVVLLDATVAGGDGCRTLEELRRLHPEMRTIVRDHAGGGELSEERVRAELLPAVLGATVVPASEPVTPIRRRRARASAVRAIVIAASTGGPDALEVVLRGLPADLHVPVLVVQHMPPEFTKLLAERLQRRCALRVAEAVDAEVVSGGHVYIAPGGLHMELATRGVEVSVVVRDGPRVNSCRPAADLLFRSAADAYGNGVLAVVLTGMGRDGLAGAEAIRRAGGIVVTQTEGSAVIASMPGAVTAAGLADAVVDVDRIGPTVAAYAAGGGQR
jgi:two-component system chemotaxis response regulator CheB